MSGEERARRDRRHRAVLPLIVMISAALVVAVSLFGVMYYNNYDWPHTVPVAQGRGD